MEKTAEVLSTVSLISYIVGGILLVAAVVLWFRLGIWTVIGDLSGRTARKSIEKMRQDNEQTGSKTYRPAGPGTSNANRGEVKPRKIAQPPVSTEQGKTAPIGGGSQEETGYLAGSQEETGYLGGSQEETGYLGGMQEETGFLGDIQEETGLLTDGPANAPQPRRAGPVKMVMLEEVTFIHTDEVI